jgi:hypothetical protein
MQPKKRVSKGHNLPSLHRQLGRRTGVVEVSFSREGGLTVTPLDGAGHDGRATQELGEKWIRRLRAILGPMQLTRLTASVPVTPSSDGSLSTEGTRQIANWLQHSVSEFKQSWHPKEAPEAVTVILEADVLSEVDPANFDIYVTSRLTSLDVVGVGAEAGAYETARSDFAQEIGAPFVVLCTGCASWLIGSGIRSFAVKIIPEHPFSRELDRKRGASKKTAAQTMH